MIFFFLIVLQLIGKLGKYRPAGTPEKLDVIKIVLSPPISSLSLDQLNNHNLQYSFTFSSDRKKNHLSLSISY